MAYQWFDIDGRKVYRPVTTHAYKRSDLSCPNVILDTMPAVQSMASGQMYDSKSAIRAEYKRLGVRELGNEKVEPKPFKPDSKANEQALVTALEKVKQGYVPS